MPPAQTDFCAAGHSRWPVDAIRNGSPLHYLCHHAFVGSCTSRQHTALCADTFHAKRFALPIECHTDALVLFMSQTRIGHSSELHEYLKKAAQTYTAMDVLRMVAVHPVLVPHYRLLVACKMLDPPTSPAEHRLFITHGLPPPPLFPGSRRPAKWPRR